MKISLQEYADKTLDAQWHMPLMTVEEACTKIGWTFENSPKCCGFPVEISSFIGSAYQAVCLECGRFIRDITGPSFGNAWVNLVDPEKVDLETDFQRRWVSGIKPELTDLPRDKRLSDNG